METGGRNPIRSLSEPCTAVTGVQNPDFLCSKPPLESWLVGDMAAGTFCMPHELGGGEHLKRRVSQVDSPLIFG